jgi:hypothetical protein
MEWLIIVLLIAVPLIGLMLVNATRDGFGFDEGSDSRLPWYEREKFERAEYTAPRYYHSRLTVHNAENGNQP